jgi:hypothetical protein
MRPDAYRRYLSDTENHELQILHDDGLYRHLRVMEPKQSMYWFDIITSPGLLTFNGDMGTWVFARLTDMFEFFRSPRGRINEHYWAEKIRGNDRYGGREYESDLFKSHVLSTFWENRRYIGDEKAAAEYWRELRRAVFEWGEWQDEQAARAALAEFERDRDECLFEDSWEWDLHDYTIHFRWALHGIVDGIARYDEAKKEAAV